MRLRNVNQFNCANLLFASLTSQKRNDRKEILRRLAMGSDYDSHTKTDKPNRKPSLHSRLQGGKYLFKNHFSVIY